MECINRFSVRQRLQVTLTSVPDGEGERLVEGVVVQQARRGVARGAAARAAGPLYGPIAKS